MADTIPDVTVSNTEWTNLNTATSIAIGNSMVISNKSNEQILLQISPTQPLVSSRDGEFLDNFPSLYSTRRVSAGENAVWAISTTKESGKVSVQEG